jgi:16S rRNA (adenine1518-N6/adenine1519-N6)-dimethyltransferase
MTEQSRTQSERQTLSFLRKRFDQAGIHPRTDLGQNFLIDLNLLGVLTDLAELGPDDVVLEVGTGTGGLTMLMAPKAAAVVTVEVDRNMFQLASEELYHYKNVTMLMMDVLHSKSKIDDKVLATVYGLVDAVPGRKFKLVANLPYAVATPLISNLLALDRPPHSMVCTVQKEVADRMVARPGTKDYGSLAIWIQCQCQAEIARVLQPTVFWPRPKVESAFVKITVDEARRAAMPDRAYFHDFVRSMFCHRRKILRGELIAACKQLSKKQVDELLVAQGLSGDARAEQLDTAAMLRLCEAVRTFNGQWTMDNGQ